MFKNCDTAFQICGLANVHGIDKCRLVIWALSISRKMFNIVLYCDVHFWKTPQHVIVSQMFQNKCIIYVIVVVAGSGVGTLCCCQLVAGAP